MAHHELVFYYQDHHTNPVLAITFKKSATQPDKLCRLQHSSKLIKKRTKHIRGAFMDILSAAKFEY